MKTTKLSNYTINELCNMVSDLEHILNTYSHIADNAPEVAKVISKVRQQLTKESNKREDEF